jgi:hypothetical protein
MGTEEGMGKSPASSVGSDDVLQVESKWPYLLRCEPWYQGTRASQTWPLVPGHFFILFLFFLLGVHFFQGLDEVDFFDESLPSLSRLG